MKTGRLCLIVAADIEYKAAADVLHKTNLKDQVALLRTGIGAINFRKRFEPELKSGDFEQVIIAGLCGALDRRLRKGDVVVYNESRFLAESITLDTTITDALSARVACTRGTGLSVKKVISRASEKALLQREHDAIAVDMETYFVASVCRELAIPTGVLRVVSDEADEDLPDFNRTLNETGEIIAWKLPQTMLSRPRASWRMISSFKRTITAFKSALEVAVAGAIGDSKRIRRLKQM